MAEITVYKSLEMDVMVSIATNCAATVEITN
jgi:hypothetical protein